MAGNYSLPRNSPYRSSEKLRRDNALSEITSNATLKAAALTNLGVASATSGSFTTPSLASPAVTGNAATGLVVAKQVSFVEDATSVTHTATVPIPAGATLIDIIVDQGVLWTDTASVLKVGDTADDDGYFTGVDLDATDLLVGEQLRISESSLWGGKEGAYLVAATGRRGPTSSNFGGKYVAGSNIVATVSVTTPSGTAGRTYMTVLYSVGEAVAPVLA